MVTHTYPIPPLPQLIRLGAGEHPADPGERPFDRMSFTFTTAFPTYQIAFVDRLVGDGSGQPVPLEGTGVLRIVFRQARAHDDDGTASVLAGPPAHLGYPRIGGRHQQHRAGGVPAVLADPGREPPVPVCVDAHHEQIPVAGPPAPPVPGAGALDDGGPHVDVCRRAAER